jgi:TRAP-type C4-dicarboxylate transport system permease small subunit
VDAEPTPTPRKRIEELIFIKVPYVVSGTLFLMAATLNIANVIARYVFFKPIFWAEEMLIFLVIWTVFVVAGSITYRGAHLCMDLVYETLKPQLQIAINILITITFLVCTIFTVTESWKVIALHYKNHSVTAGTDIPLVIPHTAVLFGFAYMAAAVIVRLRSYITGRFD